MKLTKYLYHILTIKDMCVDMEFILWVIFTKILSQVIIIKKIAIIEKIMIIKKDFDYWKRSWLLKKIVIIEKDHDCWKRLSLLKFSSNKNNVIRVVLFLFTIRFHKHKKTPKALNV